MTGDGDERNDVVVSHATDLERAAYPPPGKAEGQNSTQDDREAANVR